MNEQQFMDFIKETACAFYAAGDMAHKRIPNKQSLKNQPIDGREFDKCVNGFIATLLFAHLITGEVSPQEVGFKISVMMTSIAEFMAKANVGINFEMSTEKIAASKEDKGDNNGIGNS